MWEKLSSPGKSMKIVYPNDQPGKHTHTSKIIKTKQVVFMFLGIYMYTQTQIPTMRKEVVNLKQSKEGLGYEMGGRNKIILQSQKYKSNS